ASPSHAGLFRVPCHRPSQLDSARGAQGVEAQTLAHAYRAIEQDLEIIPVINKVDLPSADVASVRRQIEEVIGLDASGALLTSAKSGEGTREVLEAIVERVAPPRGDRERPPRALIFDAKYNPYRGVVIYARMMEGRLERNQRIMLMSNEEKYEISELGFLTPDAHPAEALEAGEVGYLICGIKTLDSTNIGDTITDAAHPAGKQLPGYKEILPVVFCGMYPAGTTDIQELRDALDKLHLNDASFQYQGDNSVALGLGFRLGFLGLLHMEIIQERLEREFDLTLVTTVPNVEYRVYTTDGQMCVVQSASQMPPAAKIERVEEPYIEVEVIAPTEYLSPVIELCKKKRGVHVRIDYLDAKRCLAIYQMPLAEIVLDFYDKLKACSRGYASLEYRMIGYRQGDLVKLDILLNGEPIDALCTIVFRDSAEWIGRTLASRLRKLIPRQQFEVAIQAAIGNRILVRETVKPLRKNVTAKCYGGDITRKRKLLEKQKEGKRRMKQVGSVEVPQEAFMALLQVGDEGR
ncbi:MAG: translation elongation factor 4, partial [Candidatus Hydrogenedentota bacterium]